jgi:hypothetical protein
MLLFRNILTLSVVTNYKHFHVTHIMQYTHIHTDTQPNPVITTSVNTTPRLYSQIYCGTNSFVTVNHNNIILLGYNDIRLLTTQNPVPFMTL